jgi:hypothetical protein
MDATAGHRHREHAAAQRAGVHCAAAGEAKLMPTTPLGAGMDMHMADIDCGSTSFGLMSPSCPRDCRGFFSYQAAGSGELAVVSRRRITLRRHRQRRHKLVPDRLQLADGRVEPGQDLRGRGHGRSLRISERLLALDTAVL